MPECEATLENSPVEMTLAIRSTITALEELTTSNGDAELMVHQLAATGTQQINTRSSIARELTFLSSHMIHHLSLITAYAREGGVDLPVSIGLAFSTAAYRDAAVG